MDSVPAAEASVSPASPAAPAVMTVTPPIRASSTTSASHWDSNDESFERSPRVISGAVVIAGAGGEAGEIDGVALSAGGVSGAADGRSGMTPGATGGAATGVATGAGISTTAGGSAATVDAGSSCPMGLKGAGKPSIPGTSTGPRVMNAAKRSGGS